MITTAMKYRRNIRRFIGAAIMLPVMMMLLLSSCYRRLIEEDEIRQEALIQVNIDWNSSGIDSNTIHKVSIRFFPKDDNGAAFDCYLEGNESQGEIMVPVGSYSVIVFNEAINDANYWANSIVFSDENSYNDFAANAVTLSETARLQQFPYYVPQQGEQFIIEPIRRLASWSLDNFEVTDNMILVTQGYRPASSLTVEENNMLNALKQITMRALIRPVTITAQVENLVSAQTMYLAMQGLSRKVNMATGITTHSPSTYLFILNGRQYALNQRDGTARNTFLCFGRTPEPESYIITADILLRSNVLYEPTTPLLFNVTNQLISGYQTNVPVNLNISIILPYIEGGVAIDDWGDDEELTVIQ